MSGFEFFEEFFEQQPAPQHVTKPSPPVVVETKISPVPYVPMTGGYLRNDDLVKPPVIPSVSIQNKQDGEYKPNNFIIPEDHTTDSDNAKNKDLVKIAGISALAIALTYAIWRR